MRAEKHEIVFRREHFELSDAKKRVAAGHFFQASLNAGEKSIYANLLIEVERETYQDKKEYKCAAVCFLTKMPRAERKNAT